MLISQKSRRLPIELYDEIIGFLWNDFPSLKACALASRVLLVPSQQRLFYCIALNAYAGESMGKPSSLYRLLARSPHLADYIQAFHIFNQYYPGALNVESSDVTPPVLGNEHDLHFEDYKFIDGKEISHLDHTIQPDTYRTVGWLPKDKFLPLFAPLLSNLKALYIFYPFDWDHLTYRVLFTLLFLMRLPSLVHLRLQCRIFPQAIVNIGANIKHLALDTSSMNVDFPFQLEHPPLQPIYLESFFVCSPSEYLGCFPASTSRIQFSRLRKLVVTAYSADDHASTQKLLRQCRDTLEDFEFMPTLTNISRLTSALKIHEMITLSGLTSLKRLAVKVCISDDNEGSNIFLWLCDLLRSGYSTPVAQHLEKLSISAYCTSPSDTHTWGSQNIPIPWEPLFDALLEDELKSLLVLNIFITGPNRRTAGLVVEKLIGCEAMVKLRCLLGLILNVRVCDQPFRFERDIRWETHDWTRWTDVNLP